MQTTEDADLVVEGLVIVERDGVYGEGETEGEIAPDDLDAVDAGEGAAIGGTWPGEVRARPCEHTQYSPKGRHFEAVTVQVQIHKAEEIFVGAFACGVFTMTRREPRDYGPKQRPTCNRPRYPQQINTVQLTYWESVQDAKKRETSLTGS